MVFIVTLKEYFLKFQRRQAILDENECYEVTEGILYGAGIAD